MGETATVETKKLIVATGITSQAYLPTFDGQDAFGAPIFHCRDMQQHEPEVLKAGERVTVFGGTKSAWDAAYACATSGMQVDWIIRESGHGPCWMAPPYVTPLKKWLEKLVTTRFLTWFSPCIWGEADGYTRVRSFLHGTWLGRKIVDAFWAVLADDVVQLDGHLERTGTVPGRARQRQRIQPIELTARYDGGEARQDRADAQTNAAVTHSPSTAPSKGRALRRWE